MMVIGITGGMASGKSTVARMFAGRGIVHVDADALVHQLMRQDRDTIAALAKAFPYAIENKNPFSINRAALARAAADSPATLYMLEHILHPRVRTKEEDAITKARRARARAVILDIPLLFESDADVLCDVVIAVHAPLTQRRRRAFGRVGMTEEKWQRLLARQLQPNARNRLADNVIHTGIGKAVTRRQVMKLMRQWRLL